MREPRLRRVVRLEAQRRAIDVGEAHRIVPAFRRRIVEAALAGADRQRRTPHQLTEGIDVDRTLRQAGAITHMTEARREPQRLAGGHVDVGAGAEFLVVVVLHDADIIIPGTGDVIPGVVGAAAQARVVTGVASVREDRPVAELRFLTIDVDALDRVRRRVAKVVETGAPFRILHPVGALTRREIKLRFARLAPLGDDLNHAVGGLGAVQRRGRRALDHFDAFDVLRIDVVEATRAGTTALTGTA